MSKKKTEQEENTKTTAEAVEEEAEVAEKAENETAEAKQSDNSKKSKKDKSGESKAAAEKKALEDEVANLKDRYLRLAAEYDNYRKRTANEKLSIYSDATAKAVTELLPVADSMQMALENLKDSDPEVLRGVELISNQLAKSFEKLKVEPYGEIGDSFDPNLHNAISRTESEELPENTISQVFQKGYKMGDKIIRHAMVQVANCD